MANRHSLHITKLNVFSEWLSTRGWEIKPVTPDSYEVLRATKAGMKYPLIVYKKLDAKEHLSIADRDSGVVHAFLNYCKDSGSNGVKNHLYQRDAENILKCWIKCPHAFGDVDYCKKETYCEGGCWSRKEVKEAVLKLLEESGSIQVMDCTGCIHKGNKQFCLNCKRGGCRDYYLVEE